MTLVYNNPGPKKQSFGQRFNQSLDAGMDILDQHLQGRQEELKTQRENEAIKKLIGEDLSGIRDPKLRQKIVEVSQEAQARKEVEKQKRVNELQGKVAPLAGAVDAINRMREIRKGGNLGRLTNLRVPFSSQTRQDIGEYKTLGNSLISFASTIPIRNRQEFETLTGKLNDPYITDAQAQGVLDAIERIISNSLQQYQADFSQQASQPKQAPEKKEKRPLTAFVK